MTYFGIFWIFYSEPTHPSRRLSQPHPRTSGAIVVDMRNQVAQELCAFEPRDG